jgi:hypothetical protein
LNNGHSSSSVSKDNVEDTPASLPIVGRLKRLETDYAAQNARIAELEGLVLALRGEVFGRVAGEQGGGVAEEGGGEGAGLGPEGRERPSVGDGAGGGLAGNGDARVKVEDKDDVESRLYSA